MSKIQALMVDDATTLIRDLWPDLEQAMQAQDTKTEGELSITIKISGNGEVCKMLATGKAKHPKMVREERKLQWVDGQLDLFQGADPSEAE